MWPQEREVISGEDILYFVRLPAVRQRRGTYCRKTVCRVCPHHYILLKATHTTANYHARTLRHVSHRHIYIFSSTKKPKQKPCSIHIEVGKGTLPLFYFLLDHITGKSMKTSLTFSFHCVTVGGYGLIQEIVIIFFAIEKRTA